MVSPPAPYATPSTDWCQHCSTETCATALPASSDTGTANNDHTAPLVASLVAGCIVVPAGACIRGVPGGRRSGGGSGAAAIPQATRRTCRIQFRFQDVHGTLAGMRDLVESSTRCRAARFAAGARTRTAQCSQREVLRAVPAPHSRVSGPIYSTPPTRDACHTVPGGCEQQRSRLESADASQLSFWGDIPTALERGRWLRSHHT
jgi:hypothetical protein